MSSSDAFSDRRKRAALAGGATGMGTAAAPAARGAGAEVAVTGRREVGLPRVPPIEANLADPAPIDADPAWCTQARSAGDVASGLTGSFPAATPVVRFPCGRS